MPFVAQQLQLLHHLVIHCFLSVLQAERKEKQERDLRKLPGCTAEQSPEELLDKIHKVRWFQLQRTACSAYSVIAEG